MHLYSSPEFYGGYHANFPVVSSHATNGMRTRMSALRYALNLLVITSIYEATGNLIVEPFAIKPRPGDREALAARGWPKSEWESIEEKYLDEVIAYSWGWKVLLCSEMEVFRWRGNIRDKLLEGCIDVWTTCRYQQQLLEKSMGIASQILPEPVNEHLFYPCAKRPKSIVATGSATYVKNTEMLIAFYRELGRLGYHRTYIGGPLVFGEKPAMHEKIYRYNMDLYHEMKSVCDVYIEPAPGTTVARVMSESEFYVNFAYHEVGCRSALEALLSGCGVIWGQHPLGEELPVLWMAKDVSEAVDACEDATGKVDHAFMREYALDTYSYAAVCQKFKELIGEY